MCLPRAVVCLGVISNRKYVNTSAYCLELTDVAGELFVVSQSTATVEEWVGPSEDRVGGAKDDDRRLAWPGQGQVGSSKCPHCQLGAGPFGRALLSPLGFARNFFYPVRVLHSKVGGQLFI